MKARDSLVVRYREELEKMSIGKKQDGDNLLFKVPANRFWLTSKSCSWFNKVVYGRPSIKWTSRRGNDNVYLK